MTTETKAKACPACGSAAHIYARIDVKWNPEAGAWEVLQPDSWDRFECTDCDAEFSAEPVGLPDPVAGLGYQPECSPTAGAPDPTGEPVAPLAQPHELETAAAAMLDAFGGDFPAWLQPHAEALASALDGYAARRLYVAGLLDDLSAFLDGFDGCEFNGEAVEALQARIAAAMGEG